MRGLCIPAAENKDVKMEERMGQLSERSFLPGEDLESRLFLRLGALGIYPEVVEIEERKVRISDRTSSVHVRIDHLLAGLEKASQDFGRRFILKDRPLAGQVGYLSWLGSHLVESGKKVSR
ncbi:hypothetical protein BOX30_11455 [Leptospirillum ferriphilum]|nr:hypothetical protein BOX30_11455 [Leptospirillum ferriphilum]